VVRCKHCWAQLPDTANYCGICGQPTSVIGDSVIMSLNLENIDTSIVANKDNNSTKVVTIPCSSLPFKDFPSQSTQDPASSHGIHEQPVFERREHQQLGKAQGTYQARIVKSRAKQTKAVRILHRQVRLLQQAHQRVTKTYRAYQSRLVQARIEQPKATNKSHHILFVSAAVPMTALIVLILMPLLVADSHPSIPSSGIPSSVLGGNAIPVLKPTPTPKPTPTSTFLCC